jgi:deazaflavin-dependent oxidoreductase (nitroreductase family)
MPSDLVLKSMNAIHRGVLALSFGKLGWAAGGMPVLELTTTGRRSGEARAVMLTSPHQDGDTIVIVASRGGDDVHPAWYLNLTADPKVKVRWKGGSQRAYTARTATADERAALWGPITKRYKNYAGYQTKTEREIPLVLLTPDV